MRKEQERKKNRKKWLMPFLILLALLIVISGICVYSLLPDLLAGAKAYNILKTYSDQTEFSMDLTAEATIDSANYSFSATIDRMDVDGHTVTVISEGGITFYYCDGIVFLENGAAYEVGSLSMENGADDEAGNLSMDYSQLLKMVLSLLENADLKAKDGVYTLTVEGTDSQEILELLFSGASGYLDSPGGLEIMFVTEDGEAEELRFSYTGSLSGGTSFSLSAALDLTPSGERRASIPAAVEEAVVDGDYEILGILTQDLLRLANAWMALNEKDPMEAELILKADCGPIALDQMITYCSQTVEETRIGALLIGGYTLYFTDGAVCDEKGNTIEYTAGDSFIQSVQLLDIVWQLCLHGSPECEESDGTYLYSLSLDEDGMKAVAAAIAPETENMDISFGTGHVEITVEREEIQSIALECEGEVRIVLMALDVSFGATIRIVETASELTIPEAVKDALIGE